MLVYDQGTCTWEQRQEAALGWARSGGGGPGLLPPLARHPSGTLMGLPTRSSRGERFGCSHIAQTQLVRSLAACLQDASFLEVWKAQSPKLLITGLFFMEIIPQPEAA